MRTYTRYIIQSRWSARGEKSWCDTMLRFLTAEDAALDLSKLRGERGDAEYRLVRQNTVEETVD